MTKQSDKRNKSSKKNYSFTGHRMIGENKSNHYDESNSDNTSDDIKQILDSPSGVQQNNSFNGLNNLNNLSNLYNTPNILNNQPYSNNMNNMNNMNIMGTIPHNQQNNNVFGDVDPTLVNNLVPIDNAQMQQMMGQHNLMGPTQMAHSLGSLANLNTVPTYGQSYGQTYGNESQIMSEMMYNQQLPTGVNQLNNLNNLAQLNNLHGYQTPQIQQTPQPQQTNNIANSLNGLASLASLNTIKML